MSDRIAVFNHGRIEQIGTPAEVYDGPPRPSWPGSSAPRTCSSEGRARCAPRRPHRSGPRRYGSRSPASCPLAGSDEARGTIADVVYLARSRATWSARGCGRRSSCSRRTSTRRRRRRRAQRRAVRLTWEPRHRRDRTTARGDRRRWRHHEDAHCASSRAGHGRPAPGAHRPLRHASRREPLRLTAKVEGTLKAVAWEGYARARVGQAVREADRLQGVTQYAGSSDEMFTSMSSGGGYDLVSASGDASNRLIASGSWRRSTPRRSRTGRIPGAPEVAANNTSAASTTGCRGCGARTC